MDKQKHIISMVAIIIVIAGVAFYGGMQYSVSQRAAARAGQGGGGMMGTDGGRLQGGGGGGQQGPGGRQGGMGGFIAGQVMAKDDKSFTVKTQDGSSKIVFYSDQTAVVKANKASATDLAVGADVVVNGKPSPDGSVAAQNVQIKTAL